MRRIKIGTRPSLLALKQAEWVSERIKRKYPGLEIEIVKIKTLGDEKLGKENRPLLLREGLFVKEIEEELLKGNIDVAVHSMKDLPTDISKDLCIAAITEREDARDVFISKKGNLKEIPSNSVIGTSSIRRKVQVLNYRKDLLVKDIKGNVDTRLKKLEDGGYDAIVLAAAGLIRLGWREKITEFISTDISLPAPGQGALGIEIRKDDKSVADIASFLNHEDSYCAVCAERVFLKRIGGGCDFPIAAYGEVCSKTLISQQSRKDDEINSLLNKSVIPLSPPLLKGDLGGFSGEMLKLTGLVGTFDGKKIIRESITGGKRDFEKLGIELSERILLKGGKEILARYKEKE